MEGRSRSQCAPYLPGRTARETHRTGQEETNLGVLRQRLTGEHRNQHFETGRVRLRLQRARKLAGLEESGLSSGRGDRGAKGLKMRTQHKIAFLLGCLALLPTHTL